VVVKDCGLHFRWQYRFFSSFISLEEGPEVSSLVGAVRSRLLSALLQDGDYWGTC